MSRADLASGPVAVSRSGPITIMGRSIDDLLSSFVHHLADPARSVVEPIFAFITVSNARSGGSDCRVAVGTALVRLVDEDLVCDRLTLRPVDRDGTVAGASPDLSNAGFSIRTRPHPLAIVAGSRQATAAMADDDAFFFAASRGGPGAHESDQTDLMTVVMRRMPPASASPA